MKEKRKERKPVKLKIKVIMKSSKNQVHYIFWQFCQEWFESSSNRTGILVTRPTAARHETITACPRGITTSCLLDFTVANSFTGSDVLN